MGVYVHFPWCLAKCPYCDFVSYASSTNDGAGYADAVLRELEARYEAFDGPRTAASLFFGGGTPSLWDARDLGRVLARIRTAFPAHTEAGAKTSDDLEVTVECNPTSLDEARARALVEVGVNRLSIGVQSLNDERLRFLGRLHDARGALEAIRSAQRAQVPRVSADLIYGLPGQTVKDACDDAVALLDLGLSHLSCYQLTIEQGTRFGELAKRGRLPLADEGAVADTFLALEELLTSRGFVHYEISNYARSGQQALHNLGYWRGDEYLGLGCGACGFLVRGGVATRYRNEVDPKRYANGAPCTDELLDASTRVRERIMLGLRTVGGLDLDEAAASVGAPGWTPARERTAAWLSERGRIVREGSRVRIPPTAWLWTDDTAARLF